MSLKDDIEQVRSAIFTTLDRHSSYFPVDTINQLMDSEYALSRIEATLALDDGPPSEGDIVYYETIDDDTMDICWEITEVKTEMFRQLLICQRDHVILMRAEEVERRIKEAGK